jgi:hypothetical protein
MVSCRWHLHLHFNSYILSPLGSLIKDQATNSAVAAKSKASAGTLVEFTCQD